MDKTSRFLIGALMAGILGGCASLPKHTTVNYYLPISTIDVKVLRTITCDAAGHVLIANNVQPTVITRANLSDQQTFDLSSASGAFSDSDITFVLTSDGMLQSVNATNTGQAGPVIKSLASIAEVAGTMLVLSAVSYTGSSPQGGTGHAPLPTTPPFSNECKSINAANKDSTIILTYTGNVSEYDNGKAIELKPDMASTFYDRTLQSVLGVTTAQMVQATARKTRPTIEVGQDTKPKTDTTLDSHFIHTRSPDLVELKVTTGITSGTDKKKALAAISGLEAKEIYDDFILIAGSGKLSSIPVTKPAPFGTKTVVASFNGIGALTSIQYVTKPGTGDAADSVNTALSKAADLNNATAKAADEERAAIAAMQKLKTCKNDSTKCD